MYNCYFKVVIQGFRVIILWVRPFWVDLAPHIFLPALLRVIPECRANNKP